ncbi:hypothetical protein BDZ91DRAFT_782100 [Kalaharituber pfeilii]|nr:hypothetical protein BDZ91DRAFT_782100 [Kalaharituber pfeilii]
MPSIEANPARCPSSYMRGGNSSWMQQLPNVDKYVQVDGADKLVRFGQPSGRPRWDATPRDARLGASQRRHRDRGASCFAIALDELRLMHTRLPCQQSAGHSPRQTPEEEGAPAEIRIAHVTQEAQVSSRPKVTAIHRNALAKPIASHVQCENARRTDIAAGAWDAWNAWNYPAPAPGPAARNGPIRKAKSWAATVTVAQRSRPCSQLSDVVSWSSNQDAVLVAARWRLWQVNLLPPWQSPLEIRPRCEDHGSSLEVDIILTFQTLTT